MDALSDRHRRMVVAGIMVGVFLSSSQATVVGTVLPTIAAALRGLEYYGWITAAYLTTWTVSSPVWGRLADLKGRRICYLLGLGFFLLGSILASVVPSPQDKNTTILWLIAFRGLQGIGGGAFGPVGQTMIGDMYDIRGRVKLQGYLAAIWGTSSLVGPIVGGLIAEALDWRWIFRLNVPLGIVAGLLVGFGWKEGPRTHTRMPSVLPICLFTGGLSLLLLGLGGHSLIEPHIAGILALACGIGFVIIELRADVKLFNFELLRRRAFFLVAFSNGFTGAVMWTAITFAPFYIQGVLGSSTMAAARALTYLMVAWTVVMAVSTRLALIFGFRKIFFTGAVLLVAAYFVLGQGPALSYNLLLVCLVVIGAGAGCVYGPSLANIQTKVTTMERASATSMIVFARALGGTLGVGAITKPLADGLDPNEILRVATSHGFTGIDVNALSRDPSLLIKAKETLGHAEAIVLQEVLMGPLRQGFTLAFFVALALLTTTLIPANLEPGLDDDEK
jgi:MFS family permease